jgi:myo-inositol-1(or 4)-monophosphatase
MTSANHEMPAPLSDQLLKDIERTAEELARLAGAEIVSALGGMLAVRYKGERAVDDESPWRDPVSEVDHKVEVLIRARLAERFPDHSVIGEEIDEDKGQSEDFVWAIDPVDGTANFINGFPLFAASIGVLYQGQPIAGALWCATSHALRAGVYHARCGGPLSFDDQAMEPKPNPAVRRRLAGVPYAGRGGNLPWDVRKTGSAAIECAFVAAGLLSVARFHRPNLWDVAGGIALVRAAGGVVKAPNGEGWTSFDRFEPSARASNAAPTLRSWTKPLILGEGEAVALLCRMTPMPAPSAETAD